MSAEAWTHCAAMRSAPSGELLTATEKLILLLLANRHNHDDNMAWPSVAKLAHESLLSERRVQQIIRALERTDVLRRVRRINPQHGGQTSNGYLIAGLDYDPEPEGRVKRIAPGRVQLVAPGGEADCTRGVKPVSPGGEGRFTGGVKPTSPKPNRNHKESTTEPTTTPTALLRRRRHFRATEDPRSLEWRSLIGPHARPLRAAQLTELARLEDAALIAGHHEWVSEAMREAATRASGDPWPYLLATLHRWIMAGKKTVFAGPQQANVASLRKGRLTATVDEWDQLAAEWNTPQSSAG